MLAGVTLLTLARDLGVSRATVSNAYNHPDQLSPALRARILRRAAELGFAGPDPLARGLRRGRVGAVGVLVDEGLSYAFSDPATVLFLDGLARELQTDGVGLLLHAGVNGQLNLDPIRNAAVDAWVIQSLPDGHPAVDAVRARRQPVVVLDQPALADVPLVGIDDAKGAASAVRHVVKLGHRRLAVISMPLQADGRHGLADASRQQSATYRVMRERLAGAAAAAGAAGIDWASVPVFECAANDPEAGTLGARELLATGRMPTAILAFSDQLALGALSAAREAGIAVPAALSVVGFDDSPAARSAVPSLSTVAQPLLDRGRAVGVLVRALLGGQSVITPAPYPVRFVARDSSAAAPQVRRRSASNRR